MTFREQLLLRKEAIAGHWLDRTARAHPSDGLLLGRQRDPFANPVGHALSEAVHALLEGLLEQVGPEQLRARLEPILKIRSIQNLPASEAVAFLFLLKDVVQAECAQLRQDSTLLLELIELMAQIDRLALIAFDVYTHWRERVQEVQLNEIRRRVSELMSQQGLGRARHRAQAQAGPTQVPGGPDA
jgi:hypothetical protein